MVVLHVLGPRSRKAAMGRGMLKGIDMPQLDWTDKSPGESGRGGAVQSHQLKEGKWRASDLLRAPDIWGRQF